MAVWMDGWMDGENRFVLLDGFGFVFEDSGRNGMHILFDVFGSQGALCLCLR